MAKTDAKALLNDKTGKNAPMVAKAPKNPNYKNSGGEDEGQMKGSGMPEKFDEPLNEHPAGIGGMDSLKDDIGEKSGFLTYGYIDKAGTPYGEAAKFNFLPPGMDISNQENAEIHEMKLTKVTDMSYPGDGWQGARDIPE